MQFGPSYRLAVMQQDVIESCKAKKKLSLLQISLLISCMNDSEGVYVPVLKRILEGSDSQCL